MYKLKTLKSTLPVSSTHSHWRRTTSPPTADIFLYEIRVLIFSYSVASFFTLPASSGKIYANSKDFFSLKTKEEEWKSWKNSLNFHPSFGVVRCAKCACVWEWRTSSENPIMQSFSSFLSAAFFCFIQFSFTNNWLFSQIRNLHTFFPLPLLPVRVKSVDSPVFVTQFLLCAGWIWDSGFSTLCSFSISLGCYTQNFNFFPFAGWEERDCRSSNDNIRHPMCLSWEIHHVWRVERRSKMCVYFSEQILCVSPYPSFGSECLHIFLCHHNDQRQLARWRERRFWNCEKLQSNFVSHRARVSSSSSGSDECNCIWYSFFIFKLNRQPTLLARATYSSNHGERRRGEWEEKVGGNKSGSYSSTA